MLHKITTTPFILLIRLYQIVFSPDQSFWGKALGLRVCIFHPTCSNYAISALRKYGLLKGFWLSTKRILRCHPWSKGGHDPLM